MKEDIEQSGIRIPISIVLATLALKILVFFSLFGEWCWLSRGQVGFAYDVSQAGHVNPKDNPPGHFGLNYAFGWNMDWMEVNGQVLDYEFSAASKASNKDQKYDEQMEWNTKEGVVMSVGYRIFGQVQDPWLFFQHFYLLEHEYEDISIDEHVYEALRQAGKVATAKMNAYAAQKSAEDIRANPEQVRTYILTETSKYVHALGFEVTRLDFLGNFEFQDGAAIQEARSQITQVTTEAQSVEQKIATRKTQLVLNQAAAKVVADNKIAAAKRRASQIKADTDGILAQLEPSVKQIGAEATMRIQMAEQYGDLMAQGVLPLAIVNQDSILASPFYTQQSVGGNGNAQAAKEVLVVPPQVKPAESQPNSPPQ